MYEWDGGKPNFVMEEENVIHYNDKGKWNSGYLHLAVAVIKMLAS